MNSESTAQQLPTDARIHVSRLEVRALTSKEANTDLPVLSPELGRHLDEVMREEDEKYAARHKVIADNRPEITYSPNDPSDWKIPPTGDGIVPDVWASRITSQTDAYFDSAKSWPKSVITDLKMQELQKVSTRSRVHNKVPPSKSKVAKRKKAKASKLARKQQRRV